MDTPEQQAAAMRAAINGIVANKELMETCQQEVSKLLFARFESLKAAGFSDTQALEIVKVRGIMP